MDSMAEIKELIQAMLQQVAIMSHHVDMLKIHNSLALVRLSLLKVSSKTAPLNINSTPPPQLRLSPPRQLQPQARTPTSQSQTPTPPTQPISKPAPVLSPPLLPLSILTAHHIPKPTPPARYPIKYLTYSEMQTRRDHGLCLNCDEHDAPAHHCQTKRILLVVPDEDYLDLGSHVLTKLADQELNIEQEIFSSALTGATNLISSNIIPNDDPKLLCDKEIFFPNTLEGVLKIDPFHVYFTKIKSDDLNHAKTTFDIVFSVGCCLTLGFCNAFVSSFLQKIRVGDAHNLFVKMIEPYFVATMVSKPLIFDPGGNIEFACFFVVRLYGYAQLNHNLRYTISTALPPIYDLEDKVIFKGSVMIRQRYGSQCYRSQRIIKCLTRYMD